MACFDDVNESRRELDIDDKLFYLSLIYLSDLNDEFCLTREINSIIIFLIIPLVTSCPRAPGYPVVPGFLFLEAATEGVIPY